MLTGILPDFTVIAFDVFAAGLGHIPRHKDAGPGEAAQHINGGAHTVGIGVIRVIDDDRAVSEHVAPPAAFHGLKTS